MEKFKQLLLDEKDLSERLSEVKKQIRAERIKFAEKKFGVKVGSIVKSYNNEYLVEVVIPPYSIASKPRLKGRKKRLNGEWSKATQNLYDWELI